MNNNSEFMPVECLNVPKVFFYDKQYEDLSMDAKLIYALLLDRKEMAIRNEWVDEYGDTYVIYPKQEIKKYLNISRYRIDQALAELEEHDQMVEVAVLMEAGFTQAELAEMVGNCKDNISRLERNKFKNPTYQLLYDIAEFFEKPVEEIFWYEEI